jgi:hypothetical protein
MDLMSFLAVWSTSFCEFTTLIDEVNKYSYSVLIIVLIIENPVVRKGLVKRTKKGRDFNSVELCFFSKTEGRLAVSGGESARETWAGVGCVFKTKAETETKKDWGVQNVSSLFVQACDLWRAWGISVEGQKLEFPTQWQMKSFLLGVCIL